MKLLSRLSILALAVVMMAGCVESLDKTHYRLECKIDRQLGVDSVSLMLLNQAYNAVYHVATVAADSASGAFVFDGQIEQPCVAYLKFSNDSTPLLFVLEQGDTQINIGVNSLVITGGDLNHEYMTYLKERKQLQGKRQMLHNEYVAALAPDSTIAVDLERQYLARDSMLIDSLEHITVVAINRQNLASAIILDRFINTLSHKNLQKIQKK